MIVIGTVVIYGLFKHGLHFFHLFVPSGVPAVLLPLVSLIEVISFCPADQPLGSSLRTFWPATSRSRSSPVSWCR